MAWSVCWSTAALVSLLFLAPGPLRADDTIRYIHSFKDVVGGLYPLSMVAHQSNGDPASFALYGVTTGGGEVNGFPGCDQHGCGIAFRLAPPGPGDEHWTFSRLYVFHGGSDGADPSSPLVFDGVGNAYGTTAEGGGQNLGIVYQLTPPPPGKHLWTRTKLHDFQAGVDGYLPVGPLAIDASGALYGTALGGRISGFEASGIVYKLIPPTAPETEWTLLVLHTFNGPDGYEPRGPLILAPSGEVIGLTYSTAFRLTPPTMVQGAWGFTTLARADFSRSKSLIQTPRGRLCAVETLYTGSGNLGGDNGRVFCLDPEPGHNLLVKTTLFRWLFSTPGAYPQSIAVLDATGSFYGLTQTERLIYHSPPFGGFLFRLDPPAGGSGPWTQTILGAPLHPSNTIDDGPPARDAAGNIYFASQYGMLHGTGAGNIFQYKP